MQKSNQRRLRLGVDSVADSRNFVTPLIDSLFAFRLASHSVISDALDRVANPGRSGALGRLPDGLTRACVTPSNHPPKTSRRWVSQKIARLSCPQSYGPSGYRDMMAFMAKLPDDSETTGLIEQAVRGDQRALSKLLGRHRERLRRMVALRLDRRLQGRVDPSDIIQEACLDAARRLPEYHQKPTMPFFLWLRWLAGQRMVDEHRKHLGAAARDVGREISLYRGALPETSSAVLAAHLLGHLTSPSLAAIRAERKIRLQGALNSLDPIDREALGLRPLRGAEQRRGGGRARPGQVGRQQALRPCLDPNQGCFGLLTWRA